MRAIFIALAAVAALTSSPARADDDWPAGCPKPDWSWNPIDWPTQRAAARIACAFARAPAQPAAPRPPPYTGYRPPPPVGPGASTEQPPVVDTAGAGDAAADRCRELTDNAMAPAVIPVELALCALSRQWKSEPSVSGDSPPPPDLSAARPAPPVEIDPAVR